MILLRGGLPFELLRAMALWGGVASERNSGAAGGLARGGQVIPGSSVDREVAVVLYRVSCCRNSQCFECFRCSSLHLGNTRRMRGPSRASRCPSSDHNSVEHRGGPSTTLRPHNFLHAARIRGKEQQAAAGHCIPAAGGATTTGPDATPPPAICQNLGGGGGQLGGGGSVGGGGGGGVLPGVGGFSLGTLVGGRPGTTIFQNPGGGGVGGAGGCRIQGPGPASPPFVIPALTGADLWDLRPPGVQEVIAGSVKDKRRPVI